jgi:hypothetical protein
MGEALLDRVISIISGDNESDSDKRILLKMISRDLTQNRYGKFYRIKTEDADPAFAFFIYEIYQIVYPVQVFLRNPANEFSLKWFCAKAQMDPQMAETAQRLSRESIEKREKTMESTVLISHLQEDLAFLTSSFYNSPRRLAAENCYRLIGTLNSFVNFNFLPFLQKFDPALKEGDFSAKPKFKPVRASYLAEDISDFLAASASIEGGEDWKTVLGALNAANGRAALNDRDLIPLEQWNIVLVKLRDLNQSKMLTLMVQHALKNPIWQRKSTTIEKKAVESWFDITSAHVQEFIGRLSNSIQNSRIEALAKELFGSAGITRMNHYTPEENDIYQRKGLGGFTYAAGLNYLLAFIQDYLDKEIRDLCDLLLIRGQWTIIEFSRETSEALYQISGMTEDIAAFDELLSEEGKLGSRLKSDLGRVDREAFRANQIRSILNGVNVHALEMINAAALSFLTVGKNLKKLMDDYQQSHHELISNWKELEFYSKSPLPQRLSETYTKINQLIQLLRLFSTMN